jgi:hypothetical protein
MGILDALKPFLHFIHAKTWKCATPYSMERMRNQADTELLIGFVVPLPKSQVTQFY